MVFRVLGKESDAAVETLRKAEVLLLGTSRSLREAAVGCITGDGSDLHAITLCSVNQLYSTAKMCWTFLHTLPLGPLQYFNFGRNKV